MYKSAIILNLLYSLQVVTGFLSNIIIAHYFGTSKISDSFFFAFSIITFQQVFLGNIININSIIHFKNGDILKFNKFIRFLILISVIGTSLLIAFGKYILRLIVDTNDIDLFYMNLLVISLCIPLINFNLFLSSILQAEHKYYKSYLYIIIQNSVFIFLLMLNSKIKPLPYFYLSLCFFFSVLFTFSYIIISEKPLIQKIILTLKNKSPINQRVTSKYSSLNLFLLLGIISIAAISIIEKAMAIKLGEGAISALSYAQRIINVMGIGLSSGFSAIILPHAMDKFLTEDKEEYLQFFRQVNKMIIILLLSGILVITFFTTFSSDILKLLFYRGKFHETSLLLTEQALTGYMGVFFNLLVNSIIVRMLIAMNEYRYTFFSYLLSLPAYFILVNKLISKEVFGVALSMSIVFLALLIINLFLYFFYSTRYRK